MRQPRIIVMCTDTEISLQLMNLLSKATPKQAGGCMIAADSIRPEQPTNYGVRINDWYNWEDSPQ